MQAENRGADKRCADGEVLMADSFLPLISDDTGVPRTRRRDGRLRIGRIKQTTASFV